LQVTPDCPPKFALKVKQEIKVDISTMDIILHQEALHTMLTFVNEAIDSFNKALDSSESKDSQLPSPFVVKKDEKKPNGESGVQKYVN
jgi:hypothetical protein